MGEFTQQATVEPTPAILKNPVRRYWLATRPPFLTVTLAGILIGIAHASYRGASIHWRLALLTLIGAVCIHAAINVLNDYYDEINGTDRNNHDRIYPFTGGSRFIQNGVLSKRQTLNFGLLLLSTGITVGIALSYVTDSRLIAFGLSGVFVGWAYSAPPFKLNSRGLGELCVALGFGILIPTGADFVQRESWDWSSLLVCLPYGLLVTNILYINQFPDRLADRNAGKHHWVVRLGPERGKWIYVFNVVAAGLILLSAIAFEHVPDLALTSLIPLLIVMHAAWFLIRNASQPARLVAPIKLTIAGALAHGLALAAVLGFAGPTS